MRYITTILMLCAVSAFGQVPSRIVDVPSLGKHPVAQDAIKSAWYAEGRLTMDYAYAGYTITTNNAYGIDNSAYSLANAKGPTGATTPSRNGLHSSAGLTVALWLKGNIVFNPTSNGDGGILGRRAASNLYFELHANDSPTRRLFWTIYDNTGGGQIEGYYNIDMYDETWRHVVAVWDGGTTTASVKIYLDGAQVTLSGTSTSGSFTTLRDVTAPVQLLSITAYPSVEGNANHVYIFNRALTAEEIKRLYVATKTF